MISAWLLSLLSVLSHGYGRRNQTGTICSVSGLHTLQFVYNIGFTLFLIDSGNKVSIINSSGFCINGAPGGGKNLYGIRSWRPTRPLTRKKGEFKRVINPFSNIVQNRSYSSWDAAFSYTQTHMERSDHHASGR